MDLKKNVHTYMRFFPGSFVGFFDVVADILHTLGEEWTAAENDWPGGKAWGSVYFKSALAIKEISKDLSRIHEEFEKVNKASTEPATPAKLVEEFNKNILKEVKS